MKITGGGIIEPILTQKQVKEIIDRIRDCDDSKFRILRRKEDSDKDPNNYMITLGIDRSDVVKIIKKTYS